MTTAAQAARLIRKELKVGFPGIKFYITSKNFAGGNAVYIRYTDGVPVAKVEKIVNDYEYGTFDGMRDIYEITNSRSDIPQVKYVIVQRDISKDVMEAKKAEIAKMYGIEDPENENAWWKALGEWSQNAIWRRLRDVTI